MTMEASPPVAMTPDNIVQWRVQELPELQGSLLLADEAREDVTDLLARFAPITRYWILRPGSSEQSDCEFVDGGSQGSIFRLGDYAIKAFHSKEDKPESAQRASNFNNLRANVALETGVRIMNAANAGAKYFYNGMRYTTPRHLGAFIPHAESDPAIRPYWVMSFEPANAPHDALPYAIQRRHKDNRYALAPFLLEALQACGSDCASVDIGEVIGSAKPIIRYEEPKKRNISQWLVGVDPYEDIDCTVVLHDAKAQLSRS